MPDTSHPALRLEQYLSAATMALPEPVAASMGEALALGTYRIRAGRYANGDAVCPLGAADDYAPPGMDFGVEENYGGTLLRFAISFDLCVTERGLDVALQIVKRTLSGGKE